MQEADDKCKRRDKTTLKKCVVLSFVNISHIPTEAVCSIYTHARMRATGRRGPSLQSLVLACENKESPAQSIEEENQPGPANQLAGQCEYANAFQNFSHFPSGNLARLMN